MGENILYIRTSDNKTIVTVDFSATGVNANNSSIKCKIQRFSALLYGALLHGRLQLRSETRRGRWTTPLGLEAMLLRCKARGRGSYFAHSGRILTRAKCKNTRVPCIGSKLNNLTWPKLNRSPSLRHAS